MVTQEQTQQELQEQEQVNKAQEIKELYGYMADLQALKESELVQYVNSRRNDEYRRYYNQAIQASREGNTAQVSHLMGMCDGIALSMNMIELMIREVADRITTLENE